MGLGGVLEVLSEAFQNLCNYRKAKHNIICNIFIIYLLTVPNSWAKNPTDAVATRTRCYSPDMVNRSSAVQSFWTSSHRRHYDDTSMAPLVLQVHQNVIYLLIIYLYLFDFADFYIYVCTHILPPCLQGRTWSNLSTEGWSSYACRPSCRGRSVSQPTEWPPQKPVDGASLCFFWRWNGNTSEIGLLHTPV